jgi:hypothetical protein
VTLVTTFRNCSGLWFADQAEEAAALHVSVFNGLSWQAPRTARRIIRDPGDSRSKIDRCIDHLVSIHGSDDRCRERQVDAAMIDGRIDSEIPDHQLIDGFAVIPRSLMELLQDHESAGAQRAMEAMLRMKRVDIAAAERAAAV